MLVPRRDSQLLGRDDAVSNQHKKMTSSLRTGDPCQSCSAYTSITNRDCISATSNRSRLSDVPSSGHVGKAPNESERGRRAGPLSLGHHDTYSCPILVQTRVASHAQMLTVSPEVQIAAVSADGQVMPGKWIEFCQFVHIERCEHDRLVSASYNCGRSEYFTPLYKNPTGDPGSPEADRIRLFQLLFRCRSDENAAD